jgi:RNA polymerase sigma-70 factor (ECF subfamily)
LLSRDATLYSDGGGKADAALNLISNCERVARFLLGAIKTSVPREVLIRFRQINGQPAAVFSLLDGMPGCVIALDVSAACITNIYIATNPDKLHRFS